jgi:hypothetical protein
MVESVCNENETDRAHFVAASNLKPKIQLSAATLAKYVGTYQLGPINMTVSLVGDQLFLSDIPLFPQTETLFDSRLAPMTFSLDANGAVTRVDIVGALGDQFTLVRKR